MLKVQEVVNFVNKKLNELGTESGYSFDIHAEVGESQNNGKINGILYTNQASTTPIPNYTENNYLFVCELLVPSARANYHFEQIEGIVESFINAVDGTEIEFAEGDGLLNITPSKPENFNVGYNAGENVPLYFTINVLYTEGSMTSAKGHWLLDENEIPYINDDIIVDKEGNVNKIYGKYNSLAFLTGQTRYFRFLFPYQIGTLGNTIQNDLLKSDFSKQYTLKYYDGVNYILNSETKPPFETKVSIFKSGNVRGQRGKTKTFDITFAEVDDVAETDEVRYYIALIDNQFDNQTENTRWFDDEVTETDTTTIVSKSAQKVQQEWYESQITNNGAKYERIKAPNLNSIDITSQIYPNTAGYDIFDLANKNYAIIKCEKGSGLTQQTKYFYYFVTNCQIGENNQVLYDLKLDTIQTYIFDKNLEFGDCYIERANLNRWGGITSGETPNVKYCYFDFGENSLLFEKEKYDNVPQRLVNREELDISAIGSVPADIVEWLNKYVSAWVYIYADPNHEFHLKMASDSNIDMKIRPYQIDQKGATHQKLSSHLSCFVYPIFKQEAYFRVKRYMQYDGKDVFIYINEKGYDKLWENNDGDSDIVGIKISLVPPFYRTENQQPLPSYTISGSLLTINADAQSADGYDVFAFNGSAVTADTGVEPSGTNIRRFNGLYTTTNQLADYKYDVKTSKKYKFRVDQVVNAQKNVEYNPKLLSQNFASVKLVNQDAEGFEYDYSKIGQQEFSIIYSEPLSPDISRSYIRLDKKYGLYNKGTTENFFGTVATNDNSLIRTTTAYQSMLAQQKNYFQQNSINRGVNLATSAISGISGTLTGGISGNPLAVFGGIYSAVKGIGEDILSKQNENFTIDNLKNAPSSIQNAKGNIFLNAMATELGVYMEEYDILSSEKQSINDYMIQYGFTVNKLGNIFEYLGNSLAEDDEGTPFFQNNYNTRHYFNYIQAKVNSISGIPMSNVARADMRQRFENGIRFWKQDNVDYTYENYEDWLEPYSI